MSSQVGKITDIPSYRVLSLRGMVIDEVPPICLPNCTRHIVHAKLSIDSFYVCVTSMDAYSQLP